MHYFTFDIKALSYMQLYLHYAGEIVLPTANFSAKFTLSQTLWRPLVATPESGESLVKQITSESRARVPKPPPYRGLNRLSTISFKDCLDPPGTLLRK